MSAATTEAWRQSHLEQVRLRQWRWRKENPGRAALYCRTSTERARQRVREILGSECLQCGLSDPDVLTYDHVANDGAQHRRELGSVRKAGYAMMRWILNHPSVAVQKLQVLCANCNIKKARAYRRAGVLP